MYKDYKYHSYGLLCNFNTNLHSNKLNDALIHIGVTACACDNLRPGNGEGILITNLNDKTKNVSMVNAALATCAAPTYFKSQQFEFNGQ